MRLRNFLRSTISLDTRLEVVGVPQGVCMSGKKPELSAGASPGAERGRFSSKRKAEPVLRLLRGEELDALSR